MKELDPTETDAVKYVLSAYEKIDELTYHPHGYEIAVSLLGQEVVDEYLEKIYGKGKTDRTGKTGNPEGEK